MRTERHWLFTLAALTFFIAASATCNAEATVVRTIRLPDGGVWPQALKDGRGVLHLIYYRGDPAAGDVFYVRSSDDGKTLSTPLRVNSGKGSAIVIGAVRGPHLAIGRNGRVHVAWMGSNSAEPKALGRLNPMLYTRLNDAGDAFEPERNVIQAHPGLDGGGSLAADADGNVYVAWHAPTTPGSGETDRRVWVTRSSDDGKTFAMETPADPTPTGACGCCGMRLFADARGTVYALYRTARESVNRDIHLLVSHDHAATFANVMADPWNVATCVMSTASVAQGGASIVAAWETESKIRFGLIDPARPADVRAFTVAGTGKNSKHPAVAVGRDGKFLLAWTEGTGWNTGGSVAWRVFDANGQAESDETGRRDDLPTWEVPAVFVADDGVFVVVY